MKEKKLSFSSLEVTSILKALSLAMLSEPLEHDLINLFVKEGSEEVLYIFYNIDFQYKIRAVQLQN